MSLCARRGNWLAQIVPAWRGTKVQEIVIASEAKQSILPRKVSLDCFASLAMTWRVSVFPRRETPESCKFIRPKKSEGAGNAGCTLHPRSRVQKMHKEAHTSIQVQRRQSDIPCAMVLTVSFVLSSVTGLCCHRRSREALASHELDTSVGVSGPHDFAVRDTGVRLSPLSASTASHRTFVTIASRPSHRVRRRELVALICPTGKAESFSRRGWTGFW